LKKKIRNGKIYITIYFNKGLDSRVKPENDTESFVSFPPARHALQGKAGRRKRESSPFINSRVKSLPATLRVARRAGENDTKI
jgi:hypothetical protein